MDLKTRIEVLPCGKCEDMIDCDLCIFRKEAKELYQQIRVEVIEELLNTPMEEFGGASLKEVYEVACALPFDKGWNACYENFLLVAEQLKGAENE